MANLNTAFSDGTGSLSIKYTGTGNDSPSVSADTNCGEDRSLQLTVQTTAGSSVIQKTLNVNQVGVREQFIPSDETEGMICADGERFLTIKEEYASNIPEGCEGGNVS